MCRRRLFQSSGPATENALSPLSLDLNKKLLGRAGLRISGIHMTDSDGEDKSVGDRAAGAVKTNRSKLKSVPNWTGSQRSEASAGDMWSRLRVLCRIPDDLQRTE